MVDQDRPADPADPAGPAASDLTAARLDCRVAVRDVELDLTVPHGRRLALVGANGSGKSTALALLAGHLRPDSGEVHLGGAVVSSSRVHVPAHRRRVVSLEQQPGLFPHLTAVANVAFGPRSRGVSRSRALARAQTELESVGCGHLADRRPHQLSGGQAQRVAVARALAVDPELILLDEPLAALDVEVAPEIRRLLAERLAGRTVVLVTHDPLDLWALAQDVAVLDRGRVVQSGPVEEVLARPGTGFAARMAGVTLIEGRVPDVNHNHNHKSDNDNDDDDTAVLRTSGGDAVAGIRSTTVPWVTGTRAIATVDPRAVTVYVSEGGPTGSARNDWPATVVALTPSGPLTRVSAELRDGQRVEAEITSRSAAELALVPGRPVRLVAKAVQINLYPRATSP